MERTIWTGDVTDGLRYFYFEDKDTLNYVFVTYIGYIWKKRVARCISAKERPVQESQVVVAWVNEPGDSNIGRY